MFPNKKESVDEFVALCIDKNIYEILINIFSAEAEYIDGKFTEMSRQSVLNSDMVKPALICLGERDCLISIKKSVEESRAKALRK